MSLIILPIRYPNAKPHMVLRYHFDFIGHVPDWQPINFQYRKPPIAPARVKRIIKWCFLIKSFIENISGKDIKKVMG